MATYVELKLNFQKLSEIEIFRKFHFQNQILSVIIMDAINDAESNIASLLPIFNKNVVFQHQMLLFHDYSH